MKALPLSYTAVTGLNGWQLNDACTAHGIGTEHGKTAKVNLLCQKLRISTSGGTSPAEFRPRLMDAGLSTAQFNEFLMLGPGKVATMQGWKKFLDKCPAVDDTQVKKYLLDEDIITVAAARKYKLSRPYQLQEMVHSINFHCLPASNNFCLLRGRCNPSQSTNEADVKSLYVVLDKMTGEPLGGYCTCTAGNCQACGHVGAMLFVVADIISSGAALPDDATCTDVPCYWANPKAAGVAPKSLHDIKVKKGTPPIRRTANDYGARYMASKPPPSMELLNRLRSDLMAAAHDLGKDFPAIHALHPSRFNLPPLVQQTVTHLPAEADSMDVDLVHCREIEIETSLPMPVADLPPLKDPNFNVDNVIIRQEMVDSLTLTEEQCAEIEEKTRGQFNNTTWFQQRRGCITSSVVSAVNKVVMGESQANVGLLVARCLRARFAHITRPPRCGVPSLKWGLTQEGEARKDYEFREAMLDLHQSVEVCTHGLVVSPEAPYLRVSPDGTVVCPCHPPKLLEIKCPIVAKDITIREAVELKKVKYLTYNDGVCSLLKDKEGYYAQIQMAMGIMGLTTCDFLVWCPNSFEVVAVPFDVSYWLTMKRNLKIFFRDSVLPGIVRGADRHSTLPLPAYSNSDDDCLDALLAYEADCSAGATSHNHPEDAEVATVAINTPKAAEAERGDTTPVTPSNNLLKAPAAATKTAQTKDSTSIVVSPLHDTPTQTTPVPGSKRAAGQTPARPKNKAPRRVLIPVDSPDVPKSPTPQKRKRNSYAVSHCKERRCRKVLPELDLADEDNNSVQCACHCGCEAHYCWPCAKVTKESEGEDWYCGMCHKRCQ